MSLRARPTPSKQNSLATITATSTITDNIPQETPPPPPPPSLTQRTLTQVLTSSAHLANLLPTGTLLAFQLLTPIVTNNGSCDSATSNITLALLLILAASCFFASFTDSFRAADGKVYYGFVTSKGMLMFDYQAASTSSPSGLPDLSKYKISFIDGIHAILSVLVFVAVALRDKNVLSCFYPVPAYQTQEVLNIVPIGIGLICSLMFMVFPTRRHGIGYPVTQ